MLKKQIGHMIVVSLKFFFDLDYTFCHGALIVILALMSIVKLFFTDIVSFFHDGLVTVREDFMIIRAELGSIKERAKKFAERELARYDASNLKEVLSGNFRNWRLD